MLPIYFTVIFLIINTNALSIGKVRAQNVTKREANVEDSFPDWVPFKNKHGEDLGEFVQVKKSKPKKRLATPVNFILRAVAEPEGDDYFDKGQGESDSDDYYEKKEWSDLNRPSEPANENKSQNHTEISDIDGVVTIITTGSKRQPLNKVKQSEEIKEQEVKKQTESSKEEVTSTEEIKPKIIEKKQEKPPKYEDYMEYDDDTPAVKKQKKVSLEEQHSEAEAKKTSILDGVDQLKERHAQEQTAINEKLKEEEIYKEERERDNIQVNLAYSGHHKYDDNRKTKKLSPDYEDYEDRENSEEKFMMSPERTKATTTQTPQRTSKYKGKKESKVETGKLSVFKNPQLYIVYDDDLEELSTTPKAKPKSKHTYDDEFSTANKRRKQKNKEKINDYDLDETATKVKPRTKPTTLYDEEYEDPTEIVKTKNKKSKNKKNSKIKEKYSSKYTSMPLKTDTNERISLVPDESDGKEGEPTLFFPKKRKNKKRKPKTTTPATDSTGAETISDNQAKPLTTAVDATGSESTVTDSTADSNSDSLADSGSTGPDSTGESGPSAPDAGTASGDLITDAVAASTDHKHEKKNENYHRESGGGREHSSSHEEEHSEEGKKAYEGVHKESKSAKGYHEKENHLGRYDDNGGIDKHHEEESKHYGSHEHEEHGKKHAKYEESGKHSKGHSTKGSHDIHKKEEYEKKVEFFEEDGDSAEEEKHGGFNEEHGHSKGGQFKKGNYKSSHEEHAKGDSGVFSKGGGLHVSKGHKQATGHDGHGKSGQANFAKQGQESGKKWIYLHGYPAKTTSLGTKQTGEQNEIEKDVSSYHVKPLQESGKIWFHNHGYNTTNPSHTQTKPRSKHRTTHSVKDVQVPAKKWIHNYGYQSNATSILDRIGRRSSQNKLANPMKPSPVSGKKWIHSHGSPAKISHLVRINRRSELYFHGPEYYG